MAENILKKFPLKALHSLYGVNWEQKNLMKTFKHTGSFTLKGLIKEFNLDTDDLIIIRAENTDTYWGTTVGIITLKEDKTDYELIDGVCHYVYTKKSFEDLRKDKDTVAYVISIDRQALQQPKHHESSLWNLTKFCNDISTRFIYKPAEDKLFLNGYKYHTWNERRTLEESLDKSGYPVFSKRLQLEHKLNKIKEDRLGKVVSTAFNKDNAELFNKLMQVKETLIEEIKNATTGEELRTVTSKMADLRYAVEQYEEHIKHLQNASNPEISTFYKYTSIGEVKKGIEKLNNRIEHIMECC